MRHFLLYILLLLMGGCARSAKTQKEHYGDANVFPISVAVREAQLRGWRKVEIYDYTYREGFWEVRLFRRPLKVSSLAWVKVTTNGNVVEFVTNPK